MVATVILGLVIFGLVAWGSLSKKTANVVRATMPAVR